MAAQGLEERFAAGSLAMLLSSRRETPGFREVAGLDFDVAAFPVAAEPATLLHSDAFCISRGGDRVAAAADFVAFATGTQGQTLAALSGRSVPALKAVADSPAFLSPGRPPASSQVFLDAIPTIRALPSWPTWTEVEDLAEVSLQRVIWQGAPAAAALAELDAASRPVLAQRRRMTALAVESARRVFPGGRRRAPVVALEDVSIAVDGGLDPGRARPLRIRQEHPAARGRRAGAARRGPDHPARARRHRRPAWAPRCRHGVSGPGPAAPPQRAGEHRLRRGRQGGRARRRPRPCGRGRRDRRGLGPARPLAGTAVRGRGAAGRVGPGAGAPAGGLPAGRAAVGARPGAPGQAAGGAARPAASHGNGGAPCHARPAGGAVARRPDRGAAGRPGRAGRHAGGAAPGPRGRLRRGVCGGPAVQPAGGRGGGRRGAHGRDPAGAVPADGGWIRAHGRPGHRRRLVG